ncbi:MAG: hypothetical protein WBQ03_20235 [Candidatus Sulfotelmatobacter sp.]
MRGNRRFRQDLRLANQTWGNLKKTLRDSLLGLLKQHCLSIAAGDLMLIDGRWYVSSSGLLRVAHRKHCQGIRVQPPKEFCELAASRFAFRATVFTSPTCKGFAGYGDADPSNVSFLVHGAEMRVAETRAVNRALRKAYGIGICSIEEIGSFAGQPALHPDAKQQSQPANGNRNHGGQKVRDRLCQIIRQHQLDPNLVKAYATDFCGVKALREATREQVENFVVHLADWAEKDRNALLCQLNNYPAQKEGAE